MGLEPEYGAQPGSGPYYAVWHCDKDTGVNKFELERVDCVTAINEYNKKSNVNLEVPQNSGSCPERYPY